MATTGSTKIQFGTFHGEKPKIIDLLSEFGCITCLTKIENIKKHMKNKKYKAVMVGYIDNYTRDTYKLYNTDTKGFIMKRDIQWEEWKMIDPE